MDFWNSAAKDRGGGIPLGGGPRGGGPVGVLVLVLKSGRGAGPRGNVISLILSIGGLCIV